ncbi:MAG: hypothetical protein QOE25_1494, partial [Actinomycetota bacterium]|nr:hypothetical protein [Actinomycetota bacterium]
METWPAGTVTLLFTDIEGSTRLLEELGDSYVETLAEHNRSLRASVENHRGIELNTWGDAFFVAFHSASDAVAAAIEAQGALEASGSVKVRMGIHTGEPIRAGEGYIGMDVHRAARIAAAGHGGQILLSRATYELLDPAGLRDLGSHRLKDVGEIQLFQVGDAVFPEVAGARSSNLPTFDPVLIGREEEQADLVRLFREGRRLVTVTGTGGIGKTRIAIEVAAGLTDEFPDGAWLVDLSMVRDPELVESVIGGVLGTTMEPAAFLGGLKSLLVLDNFEQVVGAAGVVSMLLAGCPGVACLVTSREALRIQGEQAYALPPLSEAAAVALFLERARALDPGFDADYEMMKAICRRVDRIPLAIELAAARSRLLDASELLARLDARLPVLSSGARDAPARHRTLEATVAWSYALLAERERGLFARLSVFAGGWTLQAAEDVCAADIDSLEQLVEKSLVRAEQGRFDMFETIRTYALERLDEDARADETRRRHTTYYTELARRAEPELTG